jgi:hypothetical protein
MVWLVKVFHTKTETSNILPAVLKPYVFDDMKVLSEEDRKM